MKKSLYLALFLAVISIVSALSLSLVNDLTKERIASGSDSARRESLRKMFPQGEQFKSVRVEGDVTYIESIDQVITNNQIVGYAFTVKTTGYGGDIIYMVGITVAGNYVGFQPISHNETPGFGALMNESTYRDHFNNTSIFEEVDGITGATKTTNALNNSLDEVVTYFENHLQKGQ